MFVLDPTLPPPTFSLSLPLFCLPLSSLASGHAVFEFQLHPSTVREGEIAMFTISFTNSDEVSIPDGQTVTFTVMVSGGSAIRGSGKDQRPLQIKIVFL